jgi:intracellular multiplication protein IcmV
MRTNAIPCCVCTGVGKCELTLFFVLLTAKKSHPDWFLLSQTSYLLVKRTKNKVSSHFLTLSAYGCISNGYKLIITNTYLLGSCGMAIRDIFKVSRKTFFNPSAWLDFEALKAYNLTIWNSIKGLFQSPATGQTETFDEAVARLGLTEEDIEAAKRNYFVYAIIFVVLAVALLIFTIYLGFYHRTFHGVLLGLVTTALCAAQAFRFHFWYFQIKFRQLGLTFEEWKKGKPNNSQGLKP